MSLTRTLTPTTIHEQGRSRNIAYKASDMNSIVRATMIDHYGPLNRKFGIVKHLQINKKGKFTIYNISSDTLTVKSLKGCFTSPTGGFNYDPRSFGGGCPVYIKHMLCWDSWNLDDCYNHVLKLTQGGMEYTPEGNAILNLHR